MTWSDIGMIVGILTALGLSISLLFYSLKSHKREPAEWMRLLRVGRARHVVSVFNLAAGGSYIVCLFLPGENLKIFALLLWAVALLLLIYNTIQLGTTIRKVFRVSWTRIVFASPGSVYRSLASCMLAFGIIPLVFFELFQPPSHRFSSLGLTIIGIWALCTGSLFLSFRARDYFKSLARRPENGEEAMGQDGEVLVAKAYGYFVNLILEKTVASSKVIREAVMEFLEHNPILFQGCTFGSEGGVDFKPALMNISRIKEKSRIREICLIFAGYALEYWTFRRP